MQRSKTMRAAKRRGLPAVAALAAALLVALYALPVQAQQQEVVLAQFDWPASIGTNYIIQRVLKDRLDIRTSIVPLSQEVGWQNIEKGIIHAAPEIWWPARKADIDRYVNERKTVRISLTYDNAPQGFALPRWVAEKYDIATVDDLRAQAPIFDRDGDGRGDIWVGAAAWSASEIMRIKVRDYDLNLQPYTEDTWAFYSIFQDAMAQKRPIVFYYWAPDWLFTKYDLTWVKEPAYDPAQWTHVRGDLQKSRIACAWQPAKIYLAFSEKLADSMPLVYLFFQNFTLSMDEVSRIIAEIEEIPGNPQKDPAIVAEKWVQENPETVELWFHGLR